MKIRSVRPEFFADPTMAELSHAARLLYIGLWCYADDEGRGEWLPKQIDGLIFPLENVNVELLLEQLVRSARIVRYSDGDREYFHIPTFTEYQKPNRKYDSKLPDPAECTVLPGETQPALFPQRVRSAHAHSVEGEGEGEVEGVLAPRARDEVWDTLADLFGTPTTESNRSLRGKLNRSLKAAGATGGDIRARVAAWPMHFPDATLTETALEKHWDRLGRPPARASESQVDEYQAEVRRLHRQERAEELEAQARGLP